MVRHIPIVGLDVWEHAYFLNYQNMRADYVDNLISIIKWYVVTEIYEAVLESLT